MAFGGLVLKFSLSVVCASPSRPVAPRGPGTDVLCHAVCSPGYFNSKQMKYPSRTAFLLRVGPAGASIPPVIACVLAWVPRTKKAHPSEFPDPVGMELFRNGTSQQRGGSSAGTPTSGDSREAGQLESAFPGAGGRFLGNVCRLSRPPPRLAMSQLRGSRCRVVHLQRIYGLGREKKIPPKQFFSVLVKDFYFYFFYTSLLLAKIS